VEAGRESTAHRPGVNRRRAGGTRQVTTRHYPRKRFGQHFLERPWADKVLDAIAARRDEVIIEVGPGRGALTYSLARQVRRLVAVEIDRDLGAALKTSDGANLVVLQADFLRMTAADLSSVTGTSAETASLRLVGNLPYNVASPILFKCVELVESQLPLREAVVMVQREVADRILASSGTRDYGVLAVLLRHVADVERLLNLPPGAFRPAPKVHSSLIRLRFHEPAPKPRDLALFRALVRAVFTRRRKTLANALEAFVGPGVTLLPIERAGLAPGCRPETLDIAEFVRLADAVATGAPR
jgi:16S rRNA (adenine1518-N6/adenine1519-N6)-dimethyltransferase